MMLSEPFDAERCDSAGTVEPLGDGASSPQKYLSWLVYTAIDRDAEGEKSSDAAQKIVEYVRGISDEQRLQLIENPQVEHYLHRLVQHSVRYSAHSEIIGQLAEIFPSKIKYFQEKELPHSYSYSDIKKKSHAVHMTPAPAKQDAHLFHYRPRSLAATFRAPELQLQDIRRASVAVASAVKRQEKVIYGTMSPIQRNLSMRQHSTSTKLSQFLKLSTSKSSVSEKSTLIPVLKSKLHDPHFRTSKSGTSLFSKRDRPSLLPPQTETVCVDGILLKNAFDVIEAFASGALQSEAESVYLNFSHSAHSSPYDLSVVLRTKANPEHFVITNFGIIHVYPDGMSDFQTFAEWLREASMFTLMRQIPFFRQYKLKRFFKKWHSAVKSMHLNQLTIIINRISIRFFPIYADALLKLQLLSKELMTIPFHHLIPLGGYTLDAVKHSLQGSLTKAHQFLQKYFKYCRRIICNAIDSSKKHMADLESEHHHQQFVPEVALSIQKKKQEKLEQELGAASYQVERIASFVYLAEQLVYNCLLQFAHHAADSWKEVFLVKIPKQASKGFQIPMPPHKGDGKSKKSSQANLKRGDSVNYFLISSLAMDDSGKYLSLLLA